VRGDAAWLGLLWMAACSSSPLAQRGSPDGAVDHTPVAGWETLYSPGGNLVAGWVSAQGDIYAATRPMNAVDIISSHDLGGTWGYSFAYPPVDGGAFAVRSLAAVGASNVYAAGAVQGDAGADGHPVVVVSTDGGQTFDVRYPTFAGAIMAITTDASGNLLAVGSAPDGGFFIRSTDRATSWTRTVVPGTLSLRGIWLAPDGTIYACGGVDAGESPETGVVVRSTDGGATWADVAHAPVGLSALSGTAGGRIIAVGSGYTEIELPAAGSEWITRAGDPSTILDPAGWLASVFVPDETSPPYIAVNSGYLIRTVSTDPGALPSVTFENFATSGEPQAIAVTGTGPDDVWAFGSAIFHKTLH
jgi:hypothetical protein